MPGLRHQAVYDASPLSHGVLIIWRICQFPLSSKYVLVRSSYQPPCLAPVRNKLVPKQSHLLIGAVPELGGLLQSRFLLLHP